MLKYQTWSVDKKNDFLLGLVQTAFALVKARDGEYREVYNSTVLDIVTKYLLEKNKSAKFQILKNYSDQIKGNTIKALISSKYAYGSYSWLRYTIPEALGIKLSQLDVQSISGVRSDNQTVVGAIISIKFLIETPEALQAYMLSALDSSVVKNINAISGAARSKIAVDEKEVSKIAGDFLRNYLLELMPLGYRIMVDFEYSDETDTSDTI